MAQMVVCTKQRPECYLKPGVVMGITPSSSARVPVASHPCQQLACSVFGPLSLIKRETPLLPLSVHPSLSPFTRAPSQQSRPSFFQTWVFTLSSTGCHGAAFDVLPPPLSVSCFPPPLPHAVRHAVCLSQPRLWKEIAPLFSSSSGLTPQVFILPLPVLGFTHKTPWPCSHEASS